MILPVDFILVFDADQAVTKKLSQIITPDTDMDSAVTILRRYLKTMGRRKAPQSKLHNFVPLVQLLCKKRGIKAFIPSEKERFSKYDLGVPMEIHISLPISYNPSKFVGHVFLVGYRPAYEVKGKYCELITFSNDTMGADYVPNVKFFIDLFFSTCKSLKPAFACAIEGGLEPQERPCFDYAEYYNNPYFFCVEPSLGPSYSDYDVSFLNDKTVLAKLAEIKKVMSRSELLSLIQKHSKELTVNNGAGVGVLKDIGSDPVHPRYFIRKELRKRGVKLEDGYAEKYARERGLE